MSGTRPEPAGRGNGWRLAQSSWVLPAFALGLVTWLAFYIVGVRARRRDWILAGAGYSVFSALAFFALSRNEVDADDTASTLLGLAIVLAWWGGIVHALVVNRLFLRHLLAVPTPAWSLPAPAAGSDAGYGLGNPTGDYLADRPPAAALPAGQRPVEANTARRRTLARLPGMTPELAQRWVAERARRGGFRDLEDVAEALGLQPHQIVRLRPRVSFAAPGKGPAKPRRPARRGRVLDV